MIEPPSRDSDSDTNDLWVDMFTKALLYDKFDRFRRIGSGLLDERAPAMPQEAKLVTLAFIWALTHVKEGRLGHG